MKIKPLLFLSMMYLTGASQNDTTLRFKSVKAVRSSVAANAIGVNTHLNYLGSVYDLHYADIIRPRLIELGTKHIRDHLGNKMVNDRFTELAHQHGIKLLLISDDSGKDLEQSRNEIIRLNQFIPAIPVVDLIEPANERDIGWKANWGKLCNYMATYQDIFKGNAETKAIPLLGPSFANTRNSALDFGLVCKKATALMDMGNLHAYSGLYPEAPMAGGWGISFDRAVDSYRTISGDHPIIETESGYKMSEGADGHPAVSERTAAKYAPRLVLSRLKAGINQLYFYQLINNSEDFGLLNTDGSPRLQYTALKNFIHLMGDQGGSFEPGVIDFSLKGNLEGIQQQVFQNSKGKFLLLIWQGIEGSKGGTKNNDYSDVNNPERLLRLTLSKKAKQIKVYRPSFDTMPDGNGIKPVNSYPGTSIVSLSIPDHILCVEIEFP
jgi:hypothetical protein